MNVNKNLAIAGLILVLANLVLAKAHAAQSYESAQCEPFTIMISVPYGGYEGMANIREKLKREGYERCSGHQFIIDESSIKPYTYQRRIPFNPDPLFETVMQAKVSCLNSY